MPMSAFLFISGNEQLLTLIQGGKRNCSNTFGNVQHMPDIDGDFGDTNRSIKTNYSLN